MGTLLRKVESSSSDRTYELIMGEDGRVYCTCPSWKFQKSKGGMCKHVRQYMQELASGKPAPSAGTSGGIPSSTIAPTAGARRRITPLRGELQ